MRVLHCFAGIVVVLAWCHGADAGLIHDDFSSDTSGDYTRIASLARPGSALPTMTVAGGELLLTSAGSTSQPTQTHLLHNTAVLEVGETLLLDVDLLNSDFGSNVSEVIGLTVVAQGSFPGVTPVPPGSNEDERDSQVANIHAGFRNGRDGIEGRDRFRTDVFNGPDMAGSGDEGSVDLGLSDGNDDPILATITSVFIARIATNGYEMGWIENGVTPHVVRTMNVDLGATPRVGMYTDTRNDDFAQTVDNFRIVSQVPEPSTIVLSTLGITVLGLLARKRRT